MSKRFEESDNSNLNLLGEFKRIEQQGSVYDYLARFEDLKAWVLIKHPTILEEIFLGFFVEGLKGEIRHTVKMLDPFSLSQAMEKAKHKENLLEAVAKKGKGSAVRNMGQYNNNNSQAGFKTSRFPQRDGGSTSNNVGNNLFEARRARGECYKCGERYFPGHQCKNIQLNALSGTTEQG
ncbi:hypothetical protein A4A49_30238 [Nicotiana attenuata]|uniref:Retrotransposon gag domain-containing protein n=1 Tax=Nicotiana attenuata TaxID=49451 RepID=A0A1J6IJI4_NICAT|nr:hypothetical protein A4A49_30238 [Nicotiana attenuata]